MADTIATVRTKKDGVLYNVGDTIPDMGSLVCVSIEAGNRKYFEGLSKDKAKLPTTGLATGSQVVFYDTAEIDKFDAESSTWIVFGGQ